MRNLAFTVVLLVLGILISQVPPLHAEYNNITQADIAPAITLTATASGTATQTKAFLPYRDPGSPGLARTTTQSCMITGTGTAPNFKVELLVSIDGTIFVKPETGGDLGTFNDQNSHIVAISVPLSPGGHKAKVTELGGANTISVSFVEAAQ